MNRIVFLLMALILLWGFYNQEDDVVSATDYVLSNELTSDYLVKSIEFAISQATAGTVFEDRWQVNGAIRQNHLNVYLLKPGFHLDKNTPQWLRRFGNNCAYLGSHNVVFCDVWWIERFLLERKIREEPFSFGGMPNHTLFATWLIAHEVGHILRGHSSRHFSENQLEDHIDESFLSQQLEFEADTHVVDMLREVPDLEISVVGLLASILHIEIGKKNTGRYQSPITDGPNIGSIGYSGEVVVGTSGTHPEYILRIARILELIGDFPHPANRHLETDVRDFIDSIKIQ